MRNRILLILAVLAVASCGPKSISRKVRKHISASWEKTVRFNPEDTPDSLIGLPRPYTVPCIDGGFQELYYWDTFFTNEGLIADSLVEQARDNTEDILFLIDKSVALGSVDYVLARYAFQNIFFLCRNQFVAADEEYVGASPFGNLVVRVYIYGFKYFVVGDELVTAGMPMKNLSRSS